MILLVSGATKTVYKYKDCPYIGVLVVPGAGNDLRLIPPGMKIAADNGAFSGLDAVAFVRMLERLRGKDVLWVTCPDSVADADETRRKFDVWAPLIKEYRYPIAYVLQDGATSDSIPWEQISALFIGGTTEYKLSLEVERLVREGKRRGKWIHMGRVNSATRIRYAQQIGCDSIDGTAFSKFSETHIPWAIRLLKNEQTSLGVTVC